MGTLQFAAPETLMSAKDAGPAADIYSLASTTIFALRGKPLPRDYYQKPEMTIRELNYSIELKRVLIRATSSKKERRFQSTATFEEKLLSGGDRRKQTSRAAARSSVYTSTNRSVLIGAILFALTLFAVLLSLRPWRSLLGGSGGTTTEEKKDMTAPSLSRLTGGVAGYGAAVFNKVGVPVKIITTQEAQLYREAEFGERERSLSGLQVLGTCYRRREALRARSETSIR